MRTTKTLIAVLGVAILGMTILCPLGCARHNKTETFSNYGFSFEYPAGYELTERENAKGEANSSSDGTIFVKKYDEGRTATQFMVTWYSLTTGSTWTPTEDALLAHFEKNLAGYRQIWKEDGYESVQIGEVVGDSCGGHSMLCVYYEFTAADVGGTVYGTVGELYCDRSCRLSELLTMERGAGSEDDAMAFLRVFTSSLVCH
jgi:hypothetical protein